jgi:hypothetical protein
MTAEAPGSPWRIVLPVPQVRVNHKEEEGGQRAYCCYPALSLCGMF